MSDFDGQSYASEESIARYKRYSEAKRWAVIVVDKTTPGCHKIKISESLKHADAIMETRGNPDATVITMEQAGLIKALYGLKPLP